ncbi:MAG: glycosyltransferase [Candidatus Geothermincolia bacterium]
MKWLRDLRRRIDVFDMLSLGLIACLTLVALAYWSKFPVHQDTFYHMAATSGYATAGGISLHSFWEFAPVGRAQLYPPLLHVLMFALSKTGLSMLSVGRLVSFSAYPLILVSSWYGMRRIFTTRAAFYTTIVLSSCYLLFWHSAVESAASLVLILTPLIFVAVYRNRKVSAVVLLALALYSHLVLGHLVAFGLLIYAIHRRKMFKDIFIILAGAYLLWLPWGLHILVNYKSLSFNDPVGGAGGGVTIHLLVWGLGLAGFVYCYFKKNKYYLLPSFLLGMIPIVFFYPDRFWNAHSFVPLAMLGGVALAGAHEFAGSRLKAAVTNTAGYRVVMAAVVAIPVVLLLLADPVLSQGRGGARPGLAGPGQQGGPGVQRQAPPGAPPAFNGNSPFPTPQGGPKPGNTMAPPQLPGGNSFPQNQAQPQIDSIAQQGGPGGLAGPGGPGGPGAPGGPGVPGGPGAPGGPGRDGGLRSSPTTIISLLEKSGGLGPQSLASAPLVGPEAFQLAELIESNSNPDQIVYTSSNGPLGNFITGVTGRAASGGMFHEVSPSGDRSEISADNATLIVVSGQQPGSTSVYPTGALRPTAAPGRQAGVDTSKYTKVGTAGPFTVYKNAASTAKAVNTGTVIPWYVAFSLLLLALVAAGVDWFRPGPEPPDDESTESSKDNLEPRHPGPATKGAQARGPEEGYPWPPSSSNGVGWSKAGPAGSFRRDKYALAIVPCFNEAGSVGRVVREIEAIASFVDVLVVDDGSSDGSAAIAASCGAIVVSHGHNMGIGAAVRSGMKFALKEGYRFAVQVDGDGQHDPRYIASLLEPLQSGRADVVVGSRFLGTGDYRPSVGRRLGIMLLSSAVSAAVGRRATDTTSGFRAMNRRALAFLVSNYPDDYPESESLVLMGRGGVRWTETPVSMRGRLSGVSSIRGFAPAYYMAKVLGRIALDSFGVKVPRPPVYA